MMCLQQLQFCVDASERLVCVCRERMTLLGVNGMLIMIGCMLKMDGILVVEIRISMILINL